MLPVVVNQQTPAFRNFRGTVELNSDLRLRRAHARAARVDQGMDLNGARQAACRRDDFGSAGGGRPGPDERHHLGRQSPPAGIAAVSCGSPPNDCATTIRDYAHGCGCPAVARSASLAASSDSPTNGSPTAYHVADPTPIELLHDPGPMVRTGWRWARSRPVSAVSRSTPTA